MLNLRKFFLGMLFLMPLAEIQATQSEENSPSLTKNLLALNEKDQSSLDLEKLVIRSKSSKHQSKKFTLSDFKGKFIGRGSTAGGNQPIARANIFRVKLDAHGKGVVTFLSSRTFPETFPRILTDLPARLSINSQGIGVFTIIDFPVSGLNTLFDIVARKVNGVVSHVFGIRAEVIQTDPSVPIPANFAEEVTTFEIFNQFAED